MKFKLLSMLVVAAIVIQFIPYGKEHTNPPVVAEPEWDSVQTKETFYRVCGNCHSHTTSWPGYSNIAPVSWLIQHDVDDGRKHFNVSMWELQKVNMGHEAASEVESGEMPPWFYVIGHPEAKLSENDKQIFLEGLTSTFSDKM